MQDLSSVAANQVRANALVHDVGCQDPLDVRCRLANLNHRRRTLLRYTRLESVYEVDRERVAELVRAIVGFPAVVVADKALLLRTLEIYEQYRIHFAESYLAACAELSGVGVVASFDRDIDRVPTIQCLEPSA